MTPVDIPPAAAGSHFGERIAEAGSVCILLLKALEQRVKELAAVSTVAALGADFPRAAAASGGSEEFDELLIARDELALASHLADATFERTGWVYHWVARKAVAARLGEAQARIDARLGSSSYFGNLGGNGKRSGAIEAALAGAYESSARWERHR